MLGCIWVACGSVLWWSHRISILMMDLWNVLKTDWLSDDQNVMSSVQFLKFIRKILLIQHMILSNCTVGNTETNWTQSRYKAVTTDTASPGCIHGNRFVPALVAVVSAALTEEGNDAAWPLKTSGKQNNSNKRNRNKNMAPFVCQQAADSEGSNCSVSRRFCGSESN